MNTRGCASSIAWLLSIRFYSKSFSGKKEKKKKKNTSDCSRDSRADSRVAFANILHRGDDPRRPRRTVPTISSRFASVSANRRQKSSDFRPVEYFCTAIHSTLTLSCVGVTPVRDNTSRIGRKYVSIGREKNFDSLLCASTLLHRGGSQRRLFQQRQSLGVDENSNE